MPINLSNLRTAHRSARRQSTLRRVLSKYAFGSPLDQGVRWHLFYDGKGVISSVARGKGATLSWTKGPAMEAVELGQADRLQTLAQELKISMRDQSSLGIVLHLADEIDVGIVQEGFANPEV
jgi:hypothetical protein